jgi:hypothetical protein
MRMSETQQAVDETMQAFRDAPAKVEYQRQALEGAASYFEELATMGNPAPIAFAQAIRQVLAEDRSADQWADIAGKWGAEGVIYESALKTIQEHPHLCGSALAKIAADALAKARSAA